MRILKGVLLIGLLLAVGGLQSSPVLATPVVEISYLENFISDRGSWEYAFTIFNHSDESVNVWEFQLNFEEPTPVLLNIAPLPTDWSYVADVGNRVSFVDFFSLSPGVPPEGADIGPGTSLGGFIVELDSRVRDLVFYATLENPDEPGVGIDYEGFTTPVPEPATILLLAAGISGLGFIRRRRRVCL